MIDREFLISITQKEGFTLNEAQLANFNLYAEQLVEWNKKINLTTILEPREIAIKHFLDSLLLLKAVNLPRNASLLDVGAGAGFPSLPCKLYRPDLQITMLDSLSKRISFLNSLMLELKIQASCIHGRAEEEGHKSQMREQFDCVTARAVSRLRELCEYCIPFVKVGGCFAALKGGSTCPDNTKPAPISEELAEAMSAITALGGQYSEEKEYVLPDGSRRCIIIIKKISQTPPKYPRNGGKMKKSPL